MNLVRTQRIAALRQRELLCGMAFQEDVQDEILEISFESRTSLLYEIDPVWRSEMD